MPYLTAWRASEFRWALACLLSTLLYIPSRLSRVQSIGLKAECCRWRVSPCPFHSHWVGSGRVTLRHVSPIPPLDPYVRLSPHTAHERGTFTGNFHFANSTEHSPWSACAFVGYLCTISLPSPSGPSPCARFSRVRTTMPPSCKSPCHLSAKHCILETCLFLTVPFRTMLLTLQGGLHA